MATGDVCRGCAEKDTQYVVSVRAFNQVGKGPVVYDLVYTTDTSPASGTVITHCSVLSTTDCER